MVGCFICNKKMNAHSKLNKITLHKFPSKREVLQKWHDFMVVNNMSLKNIKKSSVICSTHFSPESFVYKRRKTLKKYAVPTVITPKVKNVPCKRKTPLYGGESTPKIKIKRTLVKVSDFYNSISILPPGHPNSSSSKYDVKASDFYNSFGSILQSADSNSSMVSSSSETMYKCNTEVCNVCDNSESDLQLVDPNSSVVDVFPETISECDVEVSGDNYEVEVISSSIDINLSMESVHSETIDSSEFDGVIDHYNETNVISLSIDFNLTMPSVSSERSN